MADDIAVFASMTGLFAHFSVMTAEQLVEEVIDPETDADVLLVAQADGTWELQMSGARTIGTGLEFPMSETWFWECVNDLDDEVMGEE